MKTVEITIGPAGEIQIEAVGFKGADCEKATAFLAEALGNVTQKRRKPEYHLSACRKQRQEVGT